MSVKRQIYTESAPLAGATYDFNIGVSNIYRNLNLQDVGVHYITNSYKGSTDDLESLKESFSPEAQFDSSAQDPDRQCHPGTRQAVLTTLRNWVDNPDSKARICWLFGPAGAGKSAIAQTIARSYPRPNIAATFFFFRSDARRNDGNRLFPTLAYQLAFSMPYIRGRIATSLSERPSLLNAGIETQFKELLVRPFHAVRQGASQQSAEAVDVNPDSLKQYRELAPVIIIDGIDECADENLQRQLLKVIGDAVTDHHFPLRFLIVSRPEVHIEQTIRRFLNPVFHVDLAKREDANRDIEKYLVDEFSRIASEMDLDSTWPGKKIIDDIVSKSSGNFIFASLVIRFVGDPHGYPPTQLAIVLNIKLSKTASPLGLLDQLYLEILKRVPNQDFLRRYLALFTARISVPGGSDLHNDDAMVMNVSRAELHANLSRMRSILKFDSQNGIDVHHKSFLDFLYDASRSNLYHIPQPSGGRRFGELFIDSLIRDMSTLIKQPDHHALYGTSGLASMIGYAPPKFKLPTSEWQEVILPLLDFQAKLLQLPNLTLHITRNSAFETSQNLLLVGLYHGIFDKNENNHSVVVQSVISLRKREGIVSSTKTEAEKKNTTEKLNDLSSSISRLPEAIRIWLLNKSVINGDKLVALLLSLFSQLPETIEGWSPNKRIINLVKKILCFDYAETATRIWFVSDAQKLMDLLDYLINEKDVIGIDQETRRQATLLALQIFSRAQVLPLSSFSKPEATSGTHIYDSVLTWQGGGKNYSVHLQDFFHTLFTNRILDHRYVSPVVVDREMSIYELSGYKKGERDFSLIEKWRSMSNLNSTRIQVIFRIAQIIQYFHSMGIVLYSSFNSDDVYLDEIFRPKISCLRSLDKSQFPQSVPWNSRDQNILCFGCIVYEVFTGINTSGNMLRREVISKRPSTPEIPEYVWLLIQLCGAEDEKSRPTIDEIVKEIESWGIEMESPKLEDREIEKPTQERLSWKIKIRLGVSFLLSIVFLLYAVFIMA